MLGGADTSPSTTAGEGGDQFSSVVLMLTRQSEPAGRATSNSWYGHDASRRTTSEYEPPGGAHSTSHSMIWPGPSGDPSSNESDAVA